jgi:hypothetical protein
MVTVTVKLPPALAAQLAADARQKRVSKSALIRASLERTYSNGKSRRQPSLFERTRHLAGSVKGLPTDLSTNKKHMEGFGASA